jgi:hypothetical protein
MGEHVGVPNVGSRADPTVHRTPLADAAARGGTGASSTGMATSSATPARSGHFRSLGRYARVISDGRRVRLTSGLIKHGFPKRKVGPGEFSPTFADGDLNLDNPATTPRSTATWCKAIRPTWHRPWLRLPAPIGGSAERHGNIA